jgi:hypothetical protein
MVFMVVCGDPSCPLAALSNEDLMSPPLFTLSCIEGLVDPVVYYSITCLYAGHLLLDYLLPNVRKFPLIQIICQLTFYVELC